MSLKLKNGFHEWKPKAKRCLADLTFAGFMALAAFAILWFFLLGGFGGGR